MHSPLERMLDPIALARACDDRCLLASSYDRRGGNHDWSNYLRVEGDEAVLMDVEGPGCIVRVWTADPQQGTLRVYLDGASDPAVQAPLRDVWQHLPLSFGIGGEGAANYARSKADRLPMGHTSYCPIPFGRRCKVTVSPEDDYLYYQINYRLFGPGVEAATFVPDRGLEAGALRAAALWDAFERGVLPRPTGPTARFELPPGGTHTLLEAHGAGVVRGLTLRLPDIADERLRAHILDSIWLTAHFDDDEARDPSVRAPIGPLFLNFGQPRPARSLMIGTELDAAMVCRFAMPHYERATLRLVSRAVVPTGPIEAVVEHEPARPPDGLFRFRATWHAETPFGPDHRDYNGAACRILNLDGRDNYEMLNARAAGHFVGCGFHVDLREAPTDRAAGEGDEMFFIDDDPRLTHYGTGTEDYVNDAWGIRGYTGPMSGDALSGEWGVDPQVYGYRLHLSDCVPFARKGRFTLEHGTGNNCSGSYRSVAYWYMDPASARTRVEERRWEEIRTGLRKPTSEIT